MKKSREILDEYRFRSRSVQEEHREEIVKAFKRYLEIAENAKEFAEHTDGILLFPEMVWHIAKTGGK